MVTFNEALTGKKPPGKEPNGRIAGTFKIQKSVDEKRLAFGWASVAATAAGDTVTDYYEDIIEPDELPITLYSSTARAAKCTSAAAVPSWWRA